MPVCVTVPGVYLAGADQLGLAEIFFVLMFILFSPGCQTHQRATKMAI